MEPHSSKLQLKVGIFIAAGLVAFMFSILLLGGDKILFTRYIDVRARFTDVQGLFPGSVVTLAGMPVGNVKEIRFVPGENVLETVLKINREFQPRLTAGTKAEVRTQGALGDKFIYLLPGPMGGKALAENDLVDAVETDYMKLLTDKENGAARIIEVIKEVHVLVASLNAGGKTAEMMRNMAEASGKLNSTLAHLDGLLGEMKGNIPENKKLKTALISLSNVLEKIDQGKGTLGQLINDPSVHQNLKSFLGGSPRNRYMKDMIRETIQKSEASP